MLELFQLLKLAHLINTWVIKYIRFQVLGKFQNRIFQWYRNPSGLQSEIPSMYAMMVLQKAELCYEGPT